MLKIELTDAADQQFDLILSNVQCIMRVRWNHVADRWHMDLAVGNIVQVLGRRIVIGSDLIAPYSLGIGYLFAAPLVTGALPNRSAFRLDEVGLFHATDEDLVSAGISV